MSGSNNIKPYFRVILLQGDIEYFWHICSNPKWDIFTQSCSDILLNEANKYVEYLNCGIKHRMIRFQDINSYMENLGEFNTEWALNPRNK
jgi:hypothetical protein